MNKQVDTIKGYNGRPIVLLILDGWGLSPSWGGNAISTSNPKNFNQFWREYPHTVLQAFRKVADEYGRVGNSEIGHASIGTGRIVRQDISEINDAMKSGFFYNNPTLVKACMDTKKFKSNLHIIGMISDGAVHSHINHLYALLELAKKLKLKQACIHAILDGRDVAEQSAQKYIDLLEKKLVHIGIGQIATLSGRYYAMDKGGHTDRVEKAYLCQTKGRGFIFEGAKNAVASYYQQNITDEFIPPTIITTKGKKPPPIDDHDSLIFFNFRSDRAQNLTRAFIDPKYFRGVISRKHRLLRELYFATMTDYHLAKNLPINIAFPSTTITSNLAHLVSANAIPQIHIAESEKSAHITYFFNGGIVEPYKGEDRYIIPSPNVISYDQNPEMSVRKITDIIIKALQKKYYGLLVVNIANVDMVGHTGNIMAAVKAVDIVDQEIGKIVKNNPDGITIITADHGNAEQMVAYKSDSSLETLHSINPVPFILIDKTKKKNLFTEALETHHLDIHQLLESTHSLADIAPTILELFNIPKPADMTGQSLLKSIGYIK